MSLIALNPAYLDKVWPTVGPMIQRAIDVDPTYATLDQLQLLIRQGRTHLLVYVDEADTITGAATVDFHNTPKARIAHVGFMGGKGIVRDHVFKEAQEWMRSMGATTAQCWASGSLVQMYEKMGMTNTHQVMRLEL